MHPVNLVVYISIIQLITILRFQDSDPIYGHITGHLIELGYVNYLIVSLLERFDCISGSFVLPMDSLTRLYVEPKYMTRPNSLDMSAKRTKKERLEISIFSISFNFPSL